VIPEQLITVIASEQLLDYYEFGIFAGIQKLFRRYQLDRGHAVGVPCTG
jgi:hypothetical protein